MTITYRTIVAGLLAIGLMTSSLAYAQTPNSNATPVAPTFSGVVEKVDRNTATITINAIEYSYPLSLAVTGFPGGTVGVHELAPGIEIEFNVRETRTELAKPVITVIHVTPK